MRLSFTFLAILLATSSNVLATKNPHSHHHGGKKVATPLKAAAPTTPEKGVVEPPGVAKHVATHPKSASTHPEKGQSEPGNKSKSTSPATKVATHPKAKATKAAAPPKKVGTGTKGTPECTFSGAEGAAQVVEKKLSCSTIILSSLYVPAGITLDLENLTDGTTVVFQGTLTFGFKEWFGSIISISGHRITIKGEPGSSIDGGGARWWDGLGGNGGRFKPKVFKANNLYDSVIQGISIKNPPKNSFSIRNVLRLAVLDNTIDVRDGDVKFGGHNTDGFNVNNAVNVYFSGNRVWNQDDCMNVNTGVDVFWTNGFCSGGHGLSIGSVDNRAVVRNITFENTVLEKQQQSIRIKTVRGATASVSDITYRNIVFRGGTKYGIIVDQSYNNNGSTHIPTNGVPIKNFQLSNITGTVDDGATPIEIECGVGSCLNWVWKDVKVTGGNRSTTCMNLPPGISC